MSATTQEDVERLREALERIEATSFTKAGAAYEMVKIARSVLPPHDLASIGVSEPRGEGPSIPAGMKAWHGGDAAPADWDGGPVLWTNGSISVPTWERTSWKSTVNGGLVIIRAYTPKPSTTGGTVPEVERVVGLANRLWNQWYDRANRLDPKDTLRELIAGIRSLAASPKQAPATGVGASSGEVGGWQPIATVERENGKRLILAWDDCPCLPYHWEVGRWSRTFGWVNTYGHAFAGEPTHWMEPSPPAALSAYSPDGQEKGE